MRIVTKAEKREKWSPINPNAIIDIDRPRVNILLQNKPYFHFYISIRLFKYKRIRFAIINNNSLAIQWYLNKWHQIHLGKKRRQKKMLG